MVEQSGMEVVLLFWVRVSCSAGREGRTHTDSIGGRQVEGEGEWQAALQEARGRCVALQR